jgi:hypothetical protein
MSGTESKSDDVGADWIKVPLDPPKTETRHWCRCMGRIVYVNESTGYFELDKEEGDTHK